MKQLASNIQKENPAIKEFPTLVPTCNLYFCVPLCYQSVYFNSYKC